MFRPSCSETRDKEGDDDAEPQAGQSRVTWFQDEGPPLCAAMFELRGNTPRPDEC